MFQTFWKKKQSTKFIEINSSQIPCTVETIWMIKQVSLFFWKKQEEEFSHNYWMTIDETYESI